MHHSKPVPTLNRQKSSSYHNFTDTMINDQLQLNERVSQTRDQGTHTMKNAREMHKVLAQAGQYQDILSVSLLDPFKAVL
jgi:hypothetical protein